MAEFKIWAIPCVMFGIFLALMGAILVYTYSDMDASIKLSLRSSNSNQSVTNMQAFQKAVDATLK